MNRPLKNRTRPDVAQGKAPGKGGTPDEHDGRKRLRPGTYEQRSESLFKGTSYLSHDRPD